MNDKNKTKANTYTEHEMSVNYGVIEVQKGTVVTSIVCKERGGCIIYYRKYEDCQLRDMLVDGGIATINKTIPVRA